MSHYGAESERAYIPITVNAAAGARDRRPSGRQEPVNNIFLDIPDAGGRRRAASTGGAAQPMNIFIGDERRRGRSSRDSDDSSRSSDRSRRSRRSRDYDDLPFYLRRDLDLAAEMRREEREKERSRERRRQQDRFEDEFEERKRREQRERERIEDEIEQRKKKEKKERERIVAEAKEEEKKKKREDEELRERILDEEAERKRKKKKEKELEEKLVEEKMRQKFREAGYSEAHIDDIMRKKRSKQTGDKEWAIDLSRPTFIKVNRKYLSPDTLDRFHLPWEWDRHNSEYIIIKKYINNDFQDELFAHTKMLKEKKLITGGYVKETTTTLKPRVAEEVVKDQRTDQMYLVRSKSRSKSRNRASWMFT